MLTDSSFKMLSTLTDIKLATVSAAIEQAGFLVERDARLFFSCEPVDRDESSKTNLLSNGV
jgi:hypothetical protein